MILSGSRRSVRVVQLVVTCGVTACAVILAFTAGCRHEDFARDRLEMRGGHIAEVADTVARSETRRPMVLDRTTDRIRETIAIDVRRMPRNQRALEDYARHDWTRLRSRSPEYRRNAERILWGRPDTIERNAISLFY